MKKISISGKIFGTIIEYAMSELPNEACGLIAGKEEGDMRTIEKLYTLTNQDKSPEHFSISQHEQLQAVKNIRANGLKLLGNWHSHPDSPSRPSAEIDYSTLKKGGFMRQKQKGFFSLRLGVVGGQVTSEQLNEERCISCGVCEKTCRNGAIETYEGKISINYEKCNNCRRCAFTCPADAYDTTEGYFVYFGGLCGGIESENNGGL